MCININEREKERERERERERRKKREREREREKKTFLADLLACLLLYKRTEPDVRDYVLIDSSPHTPHPLSPTK